MVLMRNCERLVKFSRFDPIKPVNLIASGFRELQDNRKCILGKGDPFRWPCHSRTSKYHVPSRSGNRVRAKAKNRTARVCECVYLWL